MYWIFWHTQLCSKGFSLLYFLIFFHFYLLTLFSLSDIRKSSAICHTIILSKVSFTSPTVSLGVHSSCFASKSLVIEVLAWFPKLNQPEVKLSHSFHIPFFSSSWKHISFSNPIISGDVFHSIILRQQWPVPHLNCAVLYSQHCLLSDQYFWKSLMWKLYLYGIDCYESPAINYC